MSKYPEVVGQLVSVAYDQGMFKQTQVYAVADGGNGLREALQAQFPNLTFILDRPHLKQHLYEGAEAIGLTGEKRHKWVSDRLHKIDAGDVRQVIRILKRYQGQGKERITNLSEYLKHLETLLIMTTSVLKVYPLVRAKLKVLIAIFLRSASRFQGQLGIQIQ